MPEDFSVESDGDFEAMLLAILVGTICFIMTYLNFIDISLAKPWTGQKRWG
ncbi:hypothetical protein [Xanthovirga aplysinae]|uniref:hypothetical protein n=1 Tax=Xanthovirga aplysinae TaxID=2529853 RepID=UPI0012BD3748|nr:hypothetical protein [Xanthovirga aplysinae]